MWDPAKLAEHRQARGEREQLVLVTVKMDKHGTLTIFNDIDVRLGRDLMVTISDIFLLKLMELSKNLTRFQTGVSGAPFKPWEAMDYWMQRPCTRSSGRGAGTPRTDWADPSKSAARGTPEQSNMLFRCVHISVLNVHVNFHRVSDRGSHLFKIPLYGPIPQGFQAPLHSLGFDPQDYRGISGNVGSLVGTIKSAYISNAKTVVMSRLTPSLLAGATTTLATDASIVMVKGFLMVDTTGGSIAGMKFEKRTLDNRGIVQDHFQNVARVESAEALLQQAHHLTFDWAHNHQGASARTCIVVTVLNRSTRPIAISKAEGSVPLGLAVLAGCEVSNEQLMPCRSASDWDPASCALVLAYGSKMDVLCTLQTTAFELECGVDGIDPSKLKPAKGFHVTIENAESSKWWGCYSISVTDDMSVAAEPNIVAVYENQRRIAVLGIGGSWKAASLLPTDRGAWSDIDGTVEYAGQDDPALLPRGMVWAPGSTWAEGWGRGGWEYATYNFAPMVMGWTHYCAVGDMCRRRKWTRQYVLPEQGDTRASAGSAAGTAKGGGGGGGGAPAALPARVSVSEPQIAGLAKVLAKSSRSTLVLVDNQTPWTLRLTNAECVSGSFPGNGKPPPRIAPNERVMFGSISSWVGDAEAAAHYCIDDSPSDTCLVKWCNPMVNDPFSDRGKSAIAHLNSEKIDICWKSADGSTQSFRGGGQPRPTQDLNNRLEITIVQRA